MIKEFDNMDDFEKWINEEVNLRSFKHLRIEYTDEDVIE